MKCSFSAEVLNDCIVSLEKKFFSTLALFTQATYLVWVQATYCWGKHYNALASHSPGSRILSPSCFMLLKLSVWSSSRVGLQHGRLRACHIICVDVSLYKHSRNWLKRLKFVVQNILETKDWLENVYNEQTPQKCHELHEGDWRLVSLGLCKFNTSITSRRIAASTLFGRLDFTCIFDYWQAGC